ncbi:MAG: SDR family NAD(P)-dependent oxidoreductase, partial [Thermoplasmata archaeon]|nr:SDR family NAD(P)-dependent oxidoreductase [Thermoplasmata archaeon]
MNLSGKNALVTGAGGFIASHLVERLVKEGTNVSAFVRYNSRSDFGMIEQISEKAKDAITMIQGDLKDSDALIDAMDGTDVVFHLGAMIAIPYSYIHPREAVDCNVIGTLNVLQAARRNDVSKVVHTSTSEVFGTAQYVPIDEKHPIAPQSPYAASKAGADYLARTFFLSYGLPVATLRPFNTYGPRQSARAVIPTIISQALTMDHISLGKLSPTRDLTFVKDTVDGFVKMAESEKSAGETINIGSNQEISIGDLTNKILGLMGLEKEVRTDEERMRPENSEVNRLRVDNTLAKEKIGWEPRTSLSQGLQETIE